MQKFLARPEVFDAMASKNKKRKKTGRKKSGQISNAAYFTQRRPLTEKNSGGSRKSFDFKPVPEPTAVQEQATKISKQKRILKKDLTRQSSNLQ